MATTTTWRHVIFDMDGVVTSEDGYWRAAACALLDLAARLGHEPSRRAVQEPELPWRLDPDLPTIARAKALLINTNWDLCHLAALALGWKLCRHDPQNIDRLLALDWQRDEAAEPALSWPGDFEPTLHELIGEILQQAGATSGFSMMAELARLLGRAEPLFVRRGPVWEWLFRHFQRWFNGDPTATPPHAGIMHDERLILPPEQVAATLEKLLAAGWRLGIATGRTREELLPTLERFGLLHYFEAASVVTHNEVAAAEAELAAAGVHAHLSKPNPFPFLRALFPSVSAQELAFPEALLNLEGVIVVGDTTADITAGLSIGAVSIGVLTGPGGEAARAILTQAGAAFIVPDMTHLVSILC